MNNKLELSNARRLTKIIYMKKHTTNTVPRAVQILKAIEDDKYKSRTAEGISKQVGLTASKVERLITTDASLKKRVLVVPGIKKNNKTLYTTVERYKKETPLAIRVLNLLNKVRSK